MTYETGTATNPSDLLQKLAVWVAANGWVIDSSIADGSGWRLHIHRGTMYMNFRAAVAETAAIAAFEHAYGAASFSGIGLYAGSGYSGASSWKLQAGGPLLAVSYTTLFGVGMALTSGSIASYHFFSDASGDNICVVVERSSGIFSHCYWGVALNKTGIWTGGNYFGASLGFYEYSQALSTNLPGLLLSTSPPGYSENTTQSLIKVDVDSFTSKWVTIGPTTIAWYNGYTGKLGRSSLSYGSNETIPGYYPLFYRVTGKQSTQSLLLPVVFGTARDTSGHSIIGDVPNIFFTNACVKGFTPKTIYNWGSDEYMVFPGNAYNANLTHWGFAVKKV
jgi:hypothetical protein